MSGVVSKPLDVADNIRKLLSEYRSGFPFFKEVIQNANDANVGAEGNKKQVGIRWVPGLAERAEHPLLQGPALVVINDGPFSKKDRDGIVRMGLSNRAADTERVGRFGLGIKSLFHICEAFFYLESGRSPELRDIFTPWHDRTPEETIYYREWWMSDETADWDTLAAAIRELFPEFDNGWFALWIPLRSKRHCKDGWTFRTDYLGESIDSCPESLRSAFLHRAPSIADSMVFLDHIERVTFHDGRELLTIEHDREKQRIGESEYIVSRFDEFDGGQDIVGGFRAKEHWPKITDPDTTQPAPDKAKWAGGIAVTSTPVQKGSTAHLRVFWSVFLPVGNEPIVNEPVEGLDSNIHIFAHGFFFPNRDRTLVLGSDKGFKEAGDEDEESLKIQWNKELATSPNGVLTRLIPTLAKCLESGSTGPDVIEAIVRKLNSSGWFREFRQAICQEWLFARIWNGRERKWQNVAANESLLVVPRLEHKPSELENVLSEIAPGISNSLNLVFQNDEILSATRLNPKWESGELSTFLQGIEVKSLKHSAHGRRLVARLLTEFPTAATEVQKHWRELPIYEVERLTGARTVMSAREVDAIAGQGKLFRECSREIREHLPAACPEIDVWLSGRRALPPKTSPPDLSRDHVAELILDHDSLSSSENRNALVDCLIADIRHEHVRLAIRYLIHGTFEHRRCCDLLFLRGETDTWNSIHEDILNDDNQGWRLVDGEIGQGISEIQRDQLELKVCGAAAFRELCELVGKKKRQWKVGHRRDFLLTQLSHEGDIELLQELPIHQIADEQWTALDEDVWLEPPEPIPVTESFRESWEALRKNARIVTRSSNVLAAARQSQVFVRQVLNPNGIIQLACQQASAAAYGELIMGLLGVIGNPQRDTQESLKAASWLPLIDGASGKLDDFLWIEGAESELRALLREYRGDRSTFTRTDLAIDLDKPIFGKGWNVVREKLIPKGDRLIRLMVNTLQEKVELRTGLDAFESEQAFANWLNCVSLLDQPPSPVIPLIQAVFNHTDSTQREFDCVRLANVFAGRWSGDCRRRYDTVLNQLRDLHCAVERNNRTRIETVFHDYLGVAVAIGRWNDSYVRDPNFELMNSEGDWVGISKLALPVEGIAARAKANQGVVDALGQRIVGPDRTKQFRASETAARKEREVAEMLDQYGNSIADVLPLKLWGCFIALLGDGRNIKALADRLTGERSDLVRKVLFADSTDGSRMTGCQFDSMESDGVAAKVRSLTGEIFDAPFDVRLTSLLVPQPRRPGKWATSRNDYFVSADEIGRRFQFCLCNAARVSEGGGDVLRLLTKTIEILLDEVFDLKGRHAPVRPFLEKFADVGQPSLIRTQFEIVASIQIHISQLGVQIGHDTRIGEGLRLLSRSLAHEGKAQDIRERGFGSPDEELTVARELKTKGHRLIKLALEKDDVLHEQMVESMRVRIGREQYLKRSVPFEIFQNADDALAELPERSTAPSLFVVDHSEERISFIHWGRPINDTTGASEDIRSNRERDLVKMLILHGSDKQTAELGVPVTGKFGLGFKSVYLLTKSPVVVSGELAFEVMGAIYPRQLGPEREKPLREYLETTMPNHRGGTVIELPCRDSGKLVLDGFASLAPYLAVFANKINEIRLNGSGDPKVFKWTPRPIANIDGLTVSKGRIEQVGDVLLVRRGGVSWLFGVEADGLKRLPDKVPSLWATAPLHASVVLGFVVNGPFEPDPGRTELGRGEEAVRINRDISHAAAKLLEDFLRWCARQSDFPEELGEFDSAQLWESLWSLFSGVKRDGHSFDAASLAVSIVWSPESGYSAVLRDTAVIPNGMPGLLEDFTCIERIKYVARGYLDSVPGKRLLENVPDWPEWTGPDGEPRIESDHIVSPKVARILQHYLETGGIDVDSFEMPQLIEKLVGDTGRVTPGLACRLGEHFGTEVSVSPQTKENYEWSTKELKQIKEVLNNLGFKNQSGRWSKPELLLNSEESGLEKRRAQLAPPDRRLSKEYSIPAAIRFFKCCRGEMKCSPTDLKEWIVQAIGDGEDEMILAVLRFLSNPDDDLAIKASQELSRSERDDLRKHRLFTSLSLPDQRRIAHVFGIAVLEMARREGTVAVPDPEPSDQPESEEERQLFIEVEELRAAWRGNEAKAEELFTVSGVYRDLVFSGIERDADLGDLLRNVSEFSTRQYWYKLLCLGCSLGVQLGTNPSRRVATFWKHRLTNKFWSQTIPSDPGEAVTEAFGKRLEGLFEGVIHKTFKDNNASGEDASFWRRVFYDFRKMHFFVFENDLPGLIMDLAHDEAVTGNELIQFLRSGEVPVRIRDQNEPVFSGVIGQSMSAPLLFLMRELRRLKVLPPGRFDKACYYMNAPTRRIARRLEWISDSEAGGYDFETLVDQSEKCHEGMIDECPELTQFFDLPLQWYALNNPR